jgi:hypothetical protein
MLSIGIGLGEEFWRCKYKFNWKPPKGFELFEMIESSNGVETAFRTGMDSAEVVDNVNKLTEFKMSDLIARIAIPPEGDERATNVRTDFALHEHGRMGWTLARDRCFFQLGYSFSDMRPGFALFVQPLVQGLAFDIRKIIHLPGLRGNPERTYPVTAVGETYQGTFQEYTASIIASWRSQKNQRELEAVGKDMERLGLTWKVSAVRQNDTAVELQVGRLPHAVRRGAQDLVSIADVGLGVSQTLPVLVALRVAEPGQMVFLEQPEIHLHPRAQVALAEILADAANRGVLVVAETHSSLLLQGIQTLVAEGKLSPDKVSLNWFKRSEQDGMTEVVEGHFDKAGAFGDWPEDFDDVSLKAEARYLDAAESVLQEKG